MPAVFHYHIPDDKIGDMTTTDPIVIQRADLPEVVVTNHGSGYGFRLKEGSSVDATAREKALEYLAVAEAIDAHHAAHDEKKLREEAEALRSSVDGKFTTNTTIVHWLEVARAARELHGK